MTHGAHQHSPVKFKEEIDTWDHQAQQGKRKWYPS